jgi:hypothetical protein
MTASRLCVELRTQFEKLRSKGFVFKTVTLQVIMIVSLVTIIFVTIFIGNRRINATPSKACNLTSPGHRYQSKAAICVIVRDEARYIEEWVDYNLHVLKFSAIFIYDNSDDCETKQWVERQNNSKLFVTSIRGRQAQPTAFQACAKSVRREGYSFAFFADADEYLALFSEKHRDIMDFAYEYLSDPGKSSLWSQRIGAVCMNWRIFGTSGQVDYTPMPLSKRFQLRMTDNYLRNKWTKCFARVDALDIESTFSCPHNIPLKKGWRKINTNRETLTLSQSVPVHNIAAIYHYYFKSTAEYLRKRMRGGGTLGPVDALINDAMQGIDYNNKPLPVGSVKDDFVWRQLTCHVKNYRQWE